MGSAAIQGEQSAQMPRTVVPRIRAQHLRAQGIRLEWPALLMQHYGLLEYSFEARRTLVDCA